MIDLIIFIGAFLIILTLGIRLVFISSKKIETERNELDEKSRHRLQRNVKITGIIGLILGIIIIISFFYVRTL